ncbi:MULTISPECIES: putative quinol monooxygenase [unclassified Paenibacillus]|uniref:putative quinol monooxygenase n=1 Tax=unclassified Paenibacillus TaxID=185978 RepID=UPI00070BDAEC|nr:MULTISPECIES: putative quinol monooxygenase [unclassified Paenibacillus]KQX64866.1 monooxygenase [Paenibacillus sp. Root444D2]KRE52117.1 monooxygenase [Paenibacillus sp. Soil724D2]
MIIIHAEFNVYPAKHEAFLNEIQPLIAASRAEDGNISYDLLKDTEVENKFTMVEVWQDQAAIASHNASDHFTSFVGKAGNFLNAPLQVKAYQGQPV